MKNEFIELLRGIQRESNVEELISKLEGSDFFTAPASTKYHGAFEGGLLEHSLKVYHNLEKLVEQFNLSESISHDSIVIVGLLHDISKMNLYVKDYKNKKVYSENGTKSDSFGRYDWETFESYTTRPVEERFIYSNHEGTSEFMIRQYIPLTYVESVAILHHMGGKAYDSTVSDISSIYSRYPLACLLHVADMMTTYIEEV